MSNKHGNDCYWCFIEDGWNSKEVAIWRINANGGEIIGRAVNKYDAKKIVDALIGYVNNKIDPVAFEKKELSFLEFVKSSCPEPYVTMASNAILWKDRKVYDDLVNKFPEYYK